MIRLPSGIGCRLSWLAIALFVVLVPILAPMPTGSQPAPDARPETLPSIYDADGIYSEDEMRTLVRDAELLQSTGIPTLVYARAVTASDAQEEDAQAFADQVRRDWGLESASGEDDGLVLLFSWVPQDPTASTTVISSGAHTFDGNGLSAETIQRTIDRSVRSLVEQERPFEALVYLMRETRYTGIYTPPPPVPVEGLAATVGSALRWLGPLAAMAIVVVLGAMTATFWRVKPAQRQVWTTVAAVLAGAAVLWSLSVYGESRIGIASALVIVIALAVATWTWSRLGFERHGSRSVRRRAVPSTHTLMRKRRQARAMLAREAGGQR